MFKFWRVCGTILLCIAFAFSCYFALADKVVKADSNLSSVGMQYSTNWSTSGMPDYNRVILDNKPFYQNNNLYDDFYNVSIPFYNTINHNNVDYLIINEIILEPSNSSDLNTLYNNIVNYWASHTYTYNSSRYGQFIYYTYTRQFFGSHSSNTPVDKIVSVDFYFDYIDIQKDGARVYIKYCCSENRIFQTEYYFHDTNGFHLVETSFNLDVVVENKVVNIYNLPAGLVGDSSYKFIFEYNIFNKEFNDYGVSLGSSYCVRSFSDITISLIHNVFNSYYFNYGSFRFYNNFRSYYLEAFAGVNYSFNSLNTSNILINVSNDKNNVNHGWHTTDGVILNSFIIHFSNNTWVNFNWFPDDTNPWLRFDYNYYAPQNLVNSFNFDNSEFNSNALYKQDVQWYDVFGHLYNFLIYLLFDMPLISNITKPIYMLISGTTTTFNWLAGLIAGLGIFGAFAMVYLLFAIIKRFL